MNFKKQGVTEITFLSFCSLCKRVTVIPSVTPCIYFMYLSSSGSSVLSWKNRHFPKQIDKSLQVLQTLHIRE